MLKLKRIKLEDCTIGVMLGYGYRCCTLELPWLDNAQNISCIPDGTYQCEKYYSNKYKCECFRVLNVVGRSSIACHYANFTSELRGCIAVGMTIDDIDNDGVFDMTSSRKTLSTLVSKLPQRFVLEITS